MKKLIVLGAGSIGGRVAQSILPNISDEFSDIYFFDNDINKQGKNIYGYYVLKDTEYYELHKQDYSLIIATDFWREIFNECKKIGIEQKIIAIFDKYSFNNPIPINCNYKVMGGGYNFVCIQKQIDDMSLKIERLEKSISRLWNSEEEMLINNLSISSIYDFSNKSQLPNLEMLENPLSMEEVMEELERKVPKAYKIWKQLFENGKQVYIEDPSNNLLVDESRWAETFDAFGSLNWKKTGWLLDIGCGIQEIPSYLKKYPIEYIVGMDPLLPVKKHSFYFVQGIAEYIPFKDESFDYVTSVTSLDHVLLLDKALEEIHRVLKKDGKLLLWIGETENTEVYNPYREDVAPVDMYHLFHVHPSWFEPLMKKCSFVKESHYQDRWGNHFYAYRKNQ